MEELQDFFLKNLDLHGYMYVNATRGVSSCTDCGTESNLFHKLTTEPLLASPVHVYSSA
jgi:hypothetical protein